MVVTQSFPFGFQHIFRCELLVVGSFFLKGIATIADTPIFDFHDDGRKSIHEGNLFFNLHDFRL